MSPPPDSGLPFNAQLHEDDVKRGYVVPAQFSKCKQATSSHDTAVTSIDDLQTLYQDFIGVIQRATVHVVTPRDRQMLNRIHKMIEYVLREGPVFEAIIIARENKNPEYCFLYENHSHEHVYYRWKLYSLLHGEDLNNWSTDVFRMFAGGSWWKPPPINPFGGGMPEELLNPKTSTIQVKPPSKAKSTFYETKVELTASEDTRSRGSLSKAKRDLFGDILRNLDPTKANIGDAMLFCIDHSDAAQDVVEAIHDSLQLIETPFEKKIARLYLISDVLHNCSAFVTNASSYRKAFQAKLESIFEHLREYLINIEDKQKADKFKQKSLSVLGAWKDWTLFEDEFIIKLSDILLGIKRECTSREADDRKAITTVQDDLDGSDLDDETLASCLEVRGLSLRWYGSLELSEDEDAQEEQQVAAMKTQEASKQTSPIEAGEQATSVRFKTSKWETIDPDEVAEQVVTLSKWDVEEMDEEGSTDSSASGKDDDGHKESVLADRATHRHKSRIRDGRRSNGSSDDD